MKSSAVLCPRVVVEASKTEGKPYSFKLLALIPTCDRTFAIAVDRGGKLLASYKECVDTNGVWAEVLGMLLERESELIKGVRIHGAIQKRASIVKAVATAKTGGNEVISWDRDDYRADNLQVFDRDQAVELLSREMSMTGNIYNFTMGDNSVFNTGTIQGSLNRLGEEKSDLAKMLEELSKEVYASKNVEAGELLTALALECEATTPKKSLVSVYWNGLTKILPHLKSISSIAVSIEKLLT